MRPAITSVGPVLSQIGRSASLSHTLLGLLSAVPLLAFAVISPLVHGPVRRFGLERGILLALVVVTVGIVARSGAGVLGLWAGTVVIGSGVAVLNVLMPVVVQDPVRRACRPDDRSLLGCTRSRGGHRFRTVATALPSARRVASVARSLGPVDLPGHRLVGAAAAPAGRPGH